MSKNQVNRIQEQIAEQVSIIRAHAERNQLPESDEDLRIVPFVSKRCIMYCGPGRCNCVPTVGHHFCVVFESKLKNCSKEFLNEIGWLQEQVQKAHAQKPLQVSEQGTIMDESHIALMLGNT